MKAIDRPGRTLTLVERVTFEGPKAKRTVKAKVDTGAKRTSIDQALARSLGIRPLKQTIRVRCASRKTRQTRRLGKVALKVAGKRFKVKASLADRSHLRYPVILGRDVLAEGRFRIKVKG